MAVKNKALGKGIDDLIPVSDTKIKRSASGEETSVTPDKMIKISKVEPNPNQPRQNFDEDKLQELADSISIHGIIEPILVKDRKDHYEIIAGERRWRAALKAGLKEVPVIIRDYTDEQIDEISLIENIQRENLNPIEEAQAYKRLIEKHKLNQDQVAERVSKNRTTITNSMRLLKLNNEVQQMLIDEMISAGHARALLGVENPEKQYELAQRVMDERLSVRDIEKIIKDLNKPIKEKKKKEELDFLYRDLEEKMKISLGTKVTIRAKDINKGKIEIEYFSQDELERLTDILRNVSNLAD